MSASPPPRRRSEGAWLVRLAEYRAPCFQSDISLIDTSSMPSAQHVRMRSSHGTSEGTRHKATATATATA